MYSYELGLRVKASDDNDREINAAAKFAIRCVVE